MPWRETPAARRANKTAFILTVVETMEGTVFVFEKVGE